VEAILAKYPAAEVSIYLNLFAGMDDSGWPKLKNLLASHPAFSAEAVAA
jgi:hypothetical protein